MQWKCHGYRTVKEAVNALSGGRAESFLSEKPSYRYKVENTDICASWLSWYASNDVPITVVGDYDADGICATASMKLLLGRMGFTHIKTRLPKRMSEGYGMSEKIVDEIASGIVVTVDNGIAALDAIREAKEKGLVVIVTDHHLPVMKNGTAVLPPADLIIDPKAEPWIEKKGNIEKSSFDGYCGAGLVFKLAEQICGDDVTFMNKIACFAAVATIADVMPLVEDNRNLFYYGISAMKNRMGTEGMNAMIENLSSGGIVTESDIGFKIAPMLNAPGRIRDDGASDALNAMLTENLSEAYGLVYRLQNDNEARKAMKSSAVERAMQIVESRGLLEKNPVIIPDPETPEGVVGLVAGELSESLGVSSFCFTKKGNVWRGSARAGKGDNIKQALDKLHDSHPEILCGYGGHAGAAGVSVPDGQLEAFSSYIDEIMPAARPRPDYLEADMEIQSADVAQTMNELARFAPYGEANPEPVFIIRGVRLVPENGVLFRAIRDTHLKFSGGGFEAIGFGLLGNYLKLGAPREVDIIGKIGLHAFRGNVTPQVEIIDLKAGGVIRK